MSNKFRNERYIHQTLLPSGKWSFRVRYQNTTKSFSEENYPSASMAFKKAVEYRNNLLCGKLFDIHSSKTLYEILEESFDIIVVRSKTKTNILCLWNNHIKDYTTTIDEMTIEYITSRLNSLVEKLNDDQLCRVLSMFKRINKTAIIKGYINRSVVDGIIAPKSHKISCSNVVPPIDDLSLEKLIKACSEHKNAFKSVQYPIILQVLVSTGLRPAELFALEKADISSHISVYKELGSSIHDSLVVRPCKTPSSVRQIPLTTELKRLLKKASSLSQNEYLFPCEDGSLVDIRKVGNEISNIAKKQGIKFNLYMLRHKFSTVLITNGVDIRTVQELLGHTSGTMSIYYAKSNDDLKRFAIKLFSNCPRIAHENQKVR